MLIFRATTTMQLEEAIASLMSNNEIFCFCAIPLLTVY